MAPNKTASVSSLSERTAEEIRAVLARRRISATSLARELGVSQTYVWRRLSGETPFDLDDLERIAEVLDVDVRDLLPRRTRDVSYPTDRTRGTSADLHRPVEIATGQPVTTRQAPPDNRPSSRGRKVTPAPRTRRPGRIPRPYAA